MKKEAQNIDHRGRRLLLYAFTAIALALLLGRGICRAWNTGLHDFSSPYAGCILFWSGDNPYSENNIIRVLNAKNAPSTEHTPPVYSPTTFVALIPFSVLPPIAAKFIILTGSVVLLICSIWLWAECLGIPSFPRHILILWVAACNPLHTALVVANIALPATGLSLLGICLCVKKRPIYGSTLVVLACMLKPQIGTAAAIGLLTHANWRIAIWLPISLFAIFWATVLWLAVKQPAAISGWISALENECTTGSISAMSVLATQRIDPGGLWSGVTGYALPSIGQAAIACLFAIVIVYMRRQRLAENDHNSATHCWLFASAAIFLLLLGYHRGYDALLLCPVWLLIAYLRPPFRDTWALYLGQLLWILPGAGFWLWLNNKGILNFASSHLTQYLWQAVILRLHAWALLITAVGFVILAHRHSTHD